MLDEKAWLTFSVLIPPKRCSMGQANPFLLTKLIKLVFMDLTWHRYSKGPSALLTLLSWMWPFG